MLIDDVVYVALLSLSVAIGYHIKKIEDPGQKQFRSTAIGLVLTLLVSGLHIIHPLILTTVNAFIVLCCNKRYCHVVSFAFGFSYLAFFRTIHYLGFEPPPTHTNAILMILTLKMVGLAFEANQSWKRSKEKVDQLRVLKLSFLDIFNYAFCYAGILIGPYFKYQTYWDTMNAPYQSHISSHCLAFLKRRILVIPFYILAYLISQYFFPIEFLVSEDIAEWPFWNRVLYMTPVFFNFRMRIYTGFILGECVCIMAGLGVYPESSKPEAGAGPTDLNALAAFMSSPDKWSSAKYSYETVHNIQEYNSEFKPLIRDGIRSWNKTVQFWLAVFIYKQLPYSKNIRMVLTMLISSFWHGVHPGYYLCLMSAPFFLMAEVEMEKAFRKGSPLVLRYLFDWVWWIFKMQSFAYMGVAFILLRVDETLYYWKNVYFCGHLVVAALFVVGRIVTIVRKKFSKKSEMKTD